MRDTLRELVRSRSRATTLSSPLRPLRQRHTSYQIFSFFSSYPPPLTPPPLSKYRMSRVLSDHRQVDNLFGSRPPVRQKPTAMVYSSALFVARALARVKQSDSYGVFE